MRGGHLTGSPRRLGNSGYLCAQRTAGVDGVKALTLGEAPEPRPRGTDRFAGCPQDRQAHRPRYLNPLADDAVSRLIVNALRCDSLSLFQNSAVPLD
jgi:hypothetical protein